MRIEMGNVGMIEFELSEEQLAIRNLAREFAEKEIKPKAAEMDRQPDHRDCFQWNIVEKASKLGFRTLTLHKKYGGPGVDSLTTAMVLEELAVGDLGFSVIFAQTLKLAQAIQWEATEEQCQKFLIPFRDDDRFLIGTTVTEADFGSNFQSVYEEGRMTTTAVLDGDDWVINGTKQWCSGGPVSKLFRLQASTNRGRATFLVPWDTPGLMIGTIHNKMGERFAINSEVIYDNVRVPKDNMLGKPKEKPDLRNWYSRAGDVYAGACILGVGRAAYEAALEYARVRVQGGKPIIEHQAIGMMLANMFGQLEAARLLYWKAAWAADHDEFYDPKLHPMANVICKEVALKVAVQSLEIFGGYGSTKDFPMEKYLRDAVAFLHSNGTRQALTLRAAKLLVKGL